MADGLVYKKLVEKLSGEMIDMPTGEYVQSEERQRRNLSAILSKIEMLLGVPAQEAKYLLELCLRLTMCMN